jgi:hypothetical protein
MEQYGDDHPYTALPNIDGGEYMTGLFIDTGMASQTGMGMTAITWQELSAFNQCGGLDLNAWEFSRLMDMSRSYCSWNSKGGQQGDMADDVPYIDRSRSSSSYLIKQREKSIEKENDPL